MLCVYGGGVMPGRRAGSGVDMYVLYCTVYNAESPNQGSESLNFITKTIHFLHFGILFIYCTVGGRQTFRPTNRNPIKIHVPINHSNYRNHQQNRTETINKSSRKDNNQKHNIDNQANKQLHKQTTA